MKGSVLFVAMTAGLISLCSSAAAKPLKVYILAGQSNMEGHAAVRTFDHIGMDPKTAPMLNEMRNADGTPRVCDKVWISYLTGGKEGAIVKQGQLTADYGSQGKEPKIGPEYTFGIYLQKQLNEPILIIKTAWGGKSLYGDFLPPSGAKKSGKETGEYYRLMIEHVKTVLKDIKKVYPGYDPEQKYELAGFVWFQGWNDMVNGGVYPNREKPGGYDMYSDLLAALIRDVRKDLDAPKMNVVIGVMGVGGPTALYSSPRYKGVHQNFRDAMAVLTEKYWDSELSGIDERMGNKAEKEKITAKELEILKMGKSNQGYHYLGSSKILGQIGKACAEAMADFEKQKK
jgi:alpha-galactosidase